MTGLPCCSSAGARCSLAPPAPLPCSRLRPRCAHRRWHHLKQEANGRRRTAVIDVNRARADPIPIAIPALGGGGGTSAQLGQDIATW